MSTFVPAALPNMDFANLVRDKSGAVIAWRRGMSVGFMGFPPDATLFVDWISDDAARIDFIDSASELMSVDLDDGDRESIQTAGQLLDLLERRPKACAAVVLADGALTARDKDTLRERWEAYFKGRADA